MFFLSTRNYDYFYNFIVKSAKKNCEILTKENLDLLLFEKKKIPSVKYLIFFIYILFSGKIFKKNRALISFDDIEVGRFVLAKTFCEFECYVNKLKFYKILIKNFFYAGGLLNACTYYKKKYKINGAYVDHCGYLNGIIFSFFVKNKIPVYTNNYPLGIYFVNYQKNKNKSLLKYENSLRINLKVNINNLQKKQAEKKISSIVKNKNFFPWLKKTNYKQLDNINYKNFDYVIYVHSFTDGQLWFGYNDFENTLEWLEFTLNHFIKTKKKILIKPHPNFYNNTLYENAIWDKKIYNIVVKKYKKFKNLHFLSKPTHSYILNNKLNKKCVAVTEFGSVILEASYLNFKSISSAANFYNKKFNISNTWKNKNEYSKLLNYDHYKLKKPNRNDLLKLIYSLFFIYHSEYHVNHFDNIIRKNLKLTKDNYQKKFHTKARAIISNKQKIRLDQITKSKSNLIIKQISNTIMEGIA